MELRDECTTPTVNFGQQPHAVDGKGDVDNDVARFTGEMTRLSVLIDARKSIGLTKISRSFF